MARLNYDAPLPGHCEGCDEPRLSIRRYLVDYTSGSSGEAFWCGDCATLARANWSGTIKSVREASHAN